MDRTPIIVELSRPPSALPPVDPKIAVVVEQDADFRNTLTDYLLSQNFQVLSLSAAPHPDELLRLQPDVLVFDLFSIGDRNPLETLEIAGQCLTHSAIVAITSDARLAQSHQEELSRLVSALLVKPFDLDHFDQALGLAPE